LLAIMTPADIVPFAKRGAAMWNDGFWARFAFVCPDKEESKRERFPVGERIVPKSIVDPLMAWHNKLGMPNIDIEDVTDEDDKKTGRKHVVVGEYKPKTCIMDQRIPDVFYAYHDGLNDLLKKSSRTDLDGNYARFAEKAMRIAILLASFENDNYIELTHWEKAQSITERWRKNLSSLFSQVVTTAESDEKRSSEDKFVACLRKHDNLTLREIRQRTGLSADEAIQIEVNLLKLGIITSSKTLHSVRYSVKSTFKIEETIHN